MTDIETNVDKIRAQEQHEPLEQRTDEHRGQGSILDAPQLDEDGAPIDDAAADEAGAVQEGLGPDEAGYI